MPQASQEARYVGGRRVDARAVLTKLAVDLGLDGETFRGSFNLRLAAEHIARTCGFMARLGLRGFPSSMLDKGSELVRFHHEPFYGRPMAFARAVQEMAADPSAARSGLS